MEYLVVDGYNVIYSWPLLDRLRKAGLDHARDKLIDILMNYAVMSGNQVVVVFDAHMVQNNLEYAENIGKNIEVIYTRGGETADSVIEKLVGELLPKGRVHVATSDWAEQSLIFGRGAYRITPKELLENINRLRQEGERRYSSSRPADSYLENRLVDGVRKKLEDWRRKKR